MKTLWQNSRSARTVGRHAPSCNAIRRIVLATVFAMRDAVFVSTLQHICRCQGASLTLLPVYLLRGPVHCRTNYEGPGCGRSKNWPLQVRTEVSADGSSITTAGRPIPLSQVAPENIALKQDNDESGMTFDGLGSIIENVPDTDGYVLYFSEHVPE